MRRLLVETVALLMHKVAQCIKREIRIDRLGASVGTEIMYAAGL